MPDAPVPLVVGDYRPRNSFVLPEHRIVYITTTKAATTTLKWMVADLAGEDFMAYYRSLEAFQTRLMTVHADRTEKTRWRHVERLTMMSDDDIAAISRDRGWFVFTVTRDPWSRLWSAWQSKFLVRQPSYVHRFGDEPWFPRVPRAAQDVVDDFHAFVRAAPWLDSPQLKNNVHFVPQITSVRPKRINYTRIYDLPDVGELFTDLHRHLDGLGLDRELYLPRGNENPLPMIRAALDDEVIDRVRKLYKRDFAAFPDRWDPAAVPVREQPWSDDRVELVRYHTAANERIGDMRAAAKQLRIERDRATASASQTAASAAHRAVDRVLRARERIRRGRAR